MNIIRNGLAALAAFAALGLAFAPAAVADMKAYNAAVKAGDYKTASQEAKGVWSSWDKSKPETATVAREFGFAALVAGDNEAARDFGRFLVEKGASLATPDDQPLVSAVLFRAADYKISRKPPALAALREALSARTAAQGVDMTTVLSWELLYTSDWNTGAFDDVDADSNAAAGYFARSPQLKPRQRDAEIYSAAGSFLGGRNRLAQSKNSFYSEMADLHDKITADIDAATPAGAAQLWPLKWRAEAWTDAMWSYLSSTYEQVGSLTKTRIEERKLTEPRLAQFEEDAGAAAIPVCKGKWEGVSNLHYPPSKQFHGAVGSVIVNLRTDASGKVIKVDTLAAIPADVFAQTVVENASKWTFKPDAGEANCRLNSNNRLFKAVFVIG